MTKFGLFVRRVYAARFYRDGDSYGFVWRYWHPLAWILAPLVFVSNGLSNGFPDAWRYGHESGLWVNPWFTKDAKTVEWL